MSGSVARLFRNAAAPALLSALCGCASTPLSSPNRLEPPAATLPPGSPGAAGVVPPAQAAAVMVDTALSMLGQPYRFGGAAPGGFDCSGLVAYAAGGAGIRVPRTAHEQLDAGIPVSRRDLRAGDLVFMHLAHKELHVGIAIGEQRFVHAPSKGGHVRIDSLAAPPYAQGYVAARRFSALQ